LKLIAVLLFICSFASFGTPIEDCRSLYRHGKLKESQACFTRLAGASDTLTRAQAFQGLQRYTEANEAFRASERSNPKSAIVKTEWGQLYLVHYQPGDAAKLFEEAIELDPNYAPAYLGLARVAAENFDKKAVDLANEALKHDPKFFRAHELLAYLALEDSDFKQASEEAQKAIGLSPEALDGMAVLASVDALTGKAQSEWMDRILKVDPDYGEAYATSGHFLEINRRYEEAIAAFRKALELNPDLWDARSQLGINLLRVGNTQEARKNLEQTFYAHQSSPQGRNALRFLDTVNDYDTFKSGSAELIINRKEAALLRPYIEPELRRAIATYEKKYKMKLPGPVRLEVYPNHEDFIVRCIGLPGQGGLLGVTFGLVVAMDSPSARHPGEFTWASTMWHELSHVYVLTATHNLVARWFTEGLAVHEEGATSPDWGDRMTPEIVMAIQKKKLLPVAELDRGFVHPEYPAQVMVSYYQAGKICDFIVQRWGNDAILGIVRSYADRKSTPDAIQDNLHISTTAFDKDFQVWLDKETGKTVQHFEQWKEGVKSAHENFAKGNREEALRQSIALRDYYPDYVGADSLYELSAEVFLQKGNKTAAIEQLEAYRNLGGTNLDTLKKLARLEVESGKTPQAQKTLTKLNYVFPQDPEIHRSFGNLLLTAGDANGAVREARALLALKPPDVAESHYQMAKALVAAENKTEAKDHVLLSLEAAPDFKPAQQLLLQLTQNP
jgi:tetratricopeptide (TPR) repeat protein